MMSKGPWQFYHWIDKEVSGLCLGWEACATSWCKEVMARQSCLLPPGCWAVS